MKQSLISMTVLPCIIQGAIAQQQNDGLPGVPQTEAYVVTPVDTTSEVVVRKVSFLRCNNILLVSNLFLPPNFDSRKQYPAILSIHPAGSITHKTV